MSKIQNVKNLSIDKYNELVMSMQRLVSIPKSDLESLEATIETLQNKYVMEQLEKSEQDIREGRVRNIDEFIKELKEKNQ